MKRHRLVLFGVVLTASLVLGNCATEPVADEATATPEKEAEEQPEEFSEPRLLFRLQELREKARSRKPSQRHLDWDIYELEDSVYGRYSSDPDFEFAADDVETHPDDIVLKAPALVILPKVEFIVSTETGEIKFNNDGAFSITGGERGERSKILMSLKGGAE